MEHVYYRLPITSTIKYSRCALLHSASILFVEVANHHVRRNFNAVCHSTMFHPLFCRPMFAITSVPYRPPPTLHAVRIYDHTHMLSTCPVTRCNVCVLIALAVVPVSHSTQSTTVALRQTVIAVYHPVNHLLQLLLFLIRDATIVC